MKFIFWLIFLFLPHVALAETAVTANWEVDPNVPFHGSLDFNVPLGWKVYSPETPQEALRPVLTFETQKNIERVSFSWPTSEVFRAGNEEVRGYQKSFHVDVHIRPKNIDRVSKLKGRLDFIACHDTCVPLSYEIDWLSSSQTMGFFEVLLMAILGGLLLNLMPCVLPVLSLKIFGLINTTISHKHDREKLGFTILGSLCFFVLFGAVIFLLRSLGQKAGWGMHFQNPYFVSFFMWLLLVLSGRFLGIVQVKSPDVSFPVPLSFKGRSFLDGLTLAVLATPCSAPYLGIASGLALTMPFQKVMLIFVAIWFGFSLPYFVLCISPALLRRILPKPGPWMTKFEKILGGLLLASAGWNFWVLSGQTNIWIAASSFLFIIITLFLIKIWPRFQKQFLILSFVALLAPILSYESMTPKTLPVNLTKIEQEAKKGAVTLIKIGASWCLTCHANEQFFKTDAVQETLTEKKVNLISLDWTQRDSKVSDLIEGFDRDGVPFYVIFGPQHPKGQVLPELLNSGTIVRAILNA